MSAMAKDSKEYVNPTHSFSERDLEALKGFRQLLKDNGVQADWEYFDDSALVRFLRARKHTPADAYKLFLETLEWRKQWKADTMLANHQQEVENFDLIHNYWPANFHKADRDGIPVLYERVGQVDPSSFIAPLSENNLLSYHVYAQEYASQLCREQQKKLSKPVFGTIVVEDLNGIGWKHYDTKALDVLKRIINMDENNYPETLKRYYVINAPKIFMMVWKVISPWLDARTLAKIRIYGSDFQTALLEDIDAESLPAVYGGKCQCTGGCVSKGGGVFRDIKTDGTTSLPVQAVVPAREQIEVRIVVEKPLTTLSWNFKTANYDIGFGLYYSKDGKNKTCVKEVARVLANQNDHVGTFESTEIGTYHFVWDNTYSTFTKKQLSYKITTLQPPDIALDALRESLQDGLLIEPSRD